jgi:hypothetical protein
MGHEQHNFSSNMMGAETGNSKLNIKVNGVDHEYQPSGGDQEVAITEAVIFELSDSPTYAEVNEVVAAHIPCYLHVSGTGVDYMAPYVGGANDSGLRFALVDTQNKLLRWWLCLNGSNWQSGEVQVNDELGWAEINMNPIPSPKDYAKICELDIINGTEGFYTTRFQIDATPRAGARSGVFVVTAYIDKVAADSSLWTHSIQCYWESLFPNHTIVANSDGLVVVTLSSDMSKLEVWTNDYFGFYVSVKALSNSVQKIYNSHQEPGVFKYPNAIVEGSSTMWDTTGEVFVYPAEPVQGVLTIDEACLTSETANNVKAAFDHNRPVVFKSSSGTMYNITTCSVNSTSCKLNGISKTTNRLDISFVEITYTFATQTWSVTRDDSVIGEAIQDNSYALDWDEIPSMAPQIYSRVVARMTDTYNTNRGILRLRKDGLELFCSGTTNVGTVTTFKFDGSKVDTSGPYGIATHAEIVYDSGANTFTRSSADYQWNLTTI